jgi:hypothetical protein
MSACVESVREVKPQTWRGIRTLAVATSTLKAGEWERMSPTERQGEEWYMVREGLCIG